MPKPADAHLSYLLAGARLNGCRSGNLIGGGRDLTTPDGTRYISGGDASDMTRRALVRTGGPYSGNWVDAGMTWGELLAAWQPKPAEPDPRDVALDAIRDTLAKYADPAQDDRDPLDVIADILATVNR